MQKPDLNNIPQDIVDYIEYLEGLIDKMQSGGIQTESLETSQDEQVYEPPSTISILTGSQGGYFKRTLRHHYSRQHRGGMGVFDLDMPDSEVPSLIAAIDETQKALILTSFARAYHLQLTKINEAPIRARGQLISNLINLEGEEKIVAILPNPTQGYVALVSKAGIVRRFRHQVFGDYMRPGTALFDRKDFSPLVAACLTPGDGDLFIATVKGIAIRFQEKTIPPQGTRGIRIQDDDEIVSICAVSDSSGVFLLGSDGRGTIRMMSGFAANKVPGAGGKLAMKTDKLVSAISVTEQDDLFILSSLSKIIRFSAAEIPPKEGVVQGVNCMMLRNDRCVAVLASFRQA